MCFKNPRYIARYCETRPNLVLFSIRLHSILQHDRTHILLRVSLEFCM
jgi:hypothetical protein